MRKMAIVLVFLALGLAACNDDPPPTQIVLVVTATPDITSTPDTPEPPEPSAGTEGASTARPTVTPSATDGYSPAPQPSGTAFLVSPTPAPLTFPTQTVAQVQLAEQVFENGRMFWIRHLRQIWVMKTSEDNPNAGDWLCYLDTFEEGEQEIDPSLIAPEGMYQPRRGFGELWRGNDQIRESLGWALTPEFELTSNYIYLAGGYVDTNTGIYYPGPGEHRLTTLYNESISFFEGDLRGDCRGGTWRMATGS